MRGGVVTSVRNYIPRENVLATLTGRRKASQAPTPARIDWRSELIVASTALGS